MHHHATTRLEHILNKINLGGVEQGVFNPRPAPVTTATTAARHARASWACSTLLACVFKAPRDRLTGIGEAPGTPP